MSQVFAQPPTPLTEGDDGVIRVTGTRVQLEVVVTAFDEGAAPEEIVMRYPTLTVPEVYAVLAYVLANRASVDAYLATRQDAADEVRARAEKLGTSNGLRARLLARRVGT
jgi:uncharacterized protein (DUF433 family)